MKAIIFDLFETLITEWGHFKYTKRIMAEDLQIDLKDFNQHWEILQEHRYIGNVDFKQALIMSLQKMNAPVNDDLLDYVLKRRVETKAVCFSEIRKDVLTMLENLKESGYRLGIISNCTAEETIALRESRLYEYFDTVVLSCDVGLAKPDPKIYQLCCERLGVQPEDCLYVGDGGSNELIAASNVGMKAVQATWFIKEFNQNYINTDGFIPVENPIYIGYLLEI